MTNYHDEPKVMDLALDDQHTGSVLQTVGWVLLVFAGIPATWIWVGFRSGSNFWLYWVVIESALGFGLVAVGTMLRRRAARDFARLGPQIVAPSMYAAEERRRIDDREHRDEAA